MIVVCSSSDSEENEADDSRTTSILASPSSTFDIETVEGKNMKCLYGIKQKKKVVAYAQALFVAEAARYIE